MKIISKIRIFLDKKSELKRLRRNGALIMNHVNLGGEPYLIEIGENTIVASYTTFLNHDESKQVFQNLHNSTLEFNRYKTGNFGRIVIGKNCFIGYQSCILPGTTIGDNVVVGARSVVKGIIPNDVVVAGVPAKVICSIDDYEKKIKNNIIEIPNSVSKRDYFSLKKYLMDFYNL